jgi:hypothetical protein
MAPPVKPGADKREFDPPRFSTGAAVAIWLLAVALLMTRRLDQVLVAQFFADDAVFFSDAVTEGWHSIFQSYGNYSNIIPRVLAMLTAPLPWEWMPLAYSLAAFAITAWVVTRIVTARIPRWAAVAGGFAVIALPTNGWLAGCICGLHFILGALLAVNLLEPAPERRGETVRRSLEVGLIALSGPEVLLLAPVALWRAWQWRKMPRGLAVLSVFFFGALVECGVLLMHPRMMLAAPIRQGNNHYIMSTGTITDLIPTGSVLGRYAGYLFGTWAGAPDNLVAGRLVAASVGIALVLLFAGKRQSYRWQAAALLAVAVALLSAGRSTSLGWPSPFGWDSRLVYCPFVFILWSLGWLAAGTVAWRRWAAVALFVAAVVSAATHWFGDIPPDYHWKEQVREVRAGRRDVLISPCMPGFPFHSAVPKRRF